MSIQKKRVFTAWGCVAGCGSYTDSLPTNLEKWFHFKQTKVSTVTQGERLFLAFIKSNPGEHFSFLVFDSSQKLWVQIQAVVFLSQQRLSLFL